MATFAEMKTELETTKKALEERTTELEQVNRLLVTRGAMINTQEGRIAELEGTLEVRDHEVMSLRDEFMKSIFIARTPTAKSAEDAYDFTVDAVAYCMGQKTSPLMKYRAQDVEMRGLVTSPQPKNKRKRASPFT